MSEVFQDLSAHARGGHRPTRHGGLAQRRSLVLYDLTAPRDGVGAAFTITHFYFCFLLFSSYATIPLFHWLSSPSPTSSAFCILPRLPSIFFGFSQLLGMFRRCNVTDALTNFTCPPRLKSDCSKYPAILVLPNLQLFVFYEISFKQCCAVLRFTCSGQR